MNEVFNHAIVQFLTADARHSVGTGFAVSPRHILTCTHVLAAAVARDAYEPIPVDTGVTVRLPLNPSLPAIQCRVVLSYPCVAQPDLQTLEDISLLEAPVGVALRFPAWKVLAEHEHHGQAFRTYGFNRHGGGWFGGTCAGVVAEGWIQLQVDNVADENLNGLSGAPVWNVQQQAVTGMLVAKLRGNLKSYMLPIARIQQACRAFLAQGTAQASPLSSFQQQKYAALEKRRATLQTLLLRQQEALDFADDPKRQMKLEQDILTTQATLAQIEAEITSNPSSMAGL